MTLTPKMKAEIIKIMRKRSPEFLAKVKARLKGMKYNNAN